MQQLTPHLMFQDGRAEEALKFYVELFGGETILLLNYGEEAGELAGKVQIATIDIAGQQINMMDSSAVHEFDFTPSMSLFFRCESEEQLDHLYNGLMDGGNAMMPKSDYGFGPYAWLADRYGVSWQLSYNPNA
ncbi:VOC family protein [Enteractinococcus fodinae]|uniref:3-demethylubiquinone-9 3-methyltransferase (Glyoxalase superfamily) n=1 Tax=Enteractinococcus fodinae TaxID=684663 RepID=A0ABU2B684_9MICC|nr:VOC family protein [Enteractinococcus fodinae]MDR7348273.1 putative 3-demethylubiquinone-9 3-methyltransferase (glyoxalase superfamily) [Enteractinococcus fodinae]